MSQEAKKKKELNTMKTVLLIPHTPAPADPDWLLKGHAGKKLDPLEAEWFYFWKHCQDFKKLKNDKFREGVPERSQILNAIN